MRRTSALGGGKGSLDWVAVGVLSRQPAAHQKITEARAWSPRRRKTTTGSADLEAARPKLQPLTSQPLTVRSPFPDVRIAVPTSSRTAPVLERHVLPSARCRACEP